MSFARVRGHERPLRLLRRVLAAGRLPHALLFSGPEGVGKRLAALELARALNCAVGDPPGTRDACGACSSCRMAGGEAHPDILLLEPEGRWLKIAQVREAERHAALTPYAGRRRVIIVDGAEAMTLEAANAFLKTLEEPPGGAVIILVSAAPATLPPTVRSRCQEVRFGPLPDAVVVELLEADGLGPGEARRAAALAGGSVGVASLWVKHFPPEKQDRLLRGTWASLASPARALAWAKQLHDEYRERSRRELLPWALQILGTWARDLAVGAPGPGGPAARAPSPVGASAAEEGGGIPGRGAVSRAGALALYAAVARAQEALERNANLQLALDAMLLRMRAALEAAPGGSSP